MNIQNSILRNFRVVIFFLDPQKIGHGRSTAPLPVFNLIKNK